MSPFPASIWLAGCGNMGGAMLRGWIGAGVDPTAVTVIEPHPVGLPRGVMLADALPEGAPELLVLAIKPQQLDALVTRAMPGTLLLSVLAGVEEAVLRARFGPAAVIRAMPNLPVAIGKGVVALHSVDAGDAARALAERLMASLGLVEWIADEAMFDAVTALSGSGPGFVYRILEAFEEAGTALGLPADQARRFSIATVEGAAALASASNEEPATLAARVASPGGTTRAGLDVLDRDAALKRLIDATLAAAARRSAELAAEARE